MKKYTFKTRHALLMSMISLMTCFAMLVGATFAWFTDSVTSGVNRIVAGNLDVELKYKDNVQTDYTGVTATTKLFNSAANGKLWEPGAMAYETFKVSNNGSLALKYQFALNTVDYNTVTRGTNTYDLRDVLKIAVVDGAIDGTRPDTSTMTFKSWADYSGTAAFTGAIAANGEAQEKTVVIWWPDTNSNEVDNRYNLKDKTTDGWTLDKTNNGKDELYIDLGITLVATQLQNESDSFGPDYDAASTYPSASVEGATFVPTTETVSATVTAGAPTTLTAAVAPAAGAVTSVAFEAGKLTSSSTASLTVETKNVVAASASSFAVTTGNTAVASIDLTLVEITTTGEGASATTTTTQKTGNFGTATITTYIAKGLDDVSVNYNGTGDAPTLVSYAKDTGKLVFTTNHFSEYYVTASSEAYIADTNTAYQTLPEAVAAVGSKGVITLLRDSSGAGIFVGASDHKDFTVDFAGYTYTCSGPAVGSTGTQNQAWHLEKGNTVTLRNGTVKGDSSVVKMLIQNYCNLTLTDMVLDFVGSGRDYALSNNCGTVVIGGNSKILVDKNKIAFDACVTNYYPDGTKITVKDGTVIAGNIEYGVWGTIPTENKVSLTIEDGTVNGMFVVNSSLSNDVASHISITGGTFDHDPNPYVADGYIGVPNETYTSWTVHETWNKYADKNGLTINEESKTISVTTAAGLAYFNAHAAEYANYTVTLQNDINLTGHIWTPIKGVRYITFDGANHTISNMTAASLNGKDVALFHSIYGSTVKDLVIDNATAIGINRISGIVAYHNSGVVDNCTVKNSTFTACVYKNDDGDKVAAISGLFIGEPSAGMKNCKVENVTLTGYRDTGSLAGYVGCYGNEFNVHSTPETCYITDNTVSNVTINNVKSPNYKNYSEDNQYDVNELVGDSTSTNWSDTYRTYSGNTCTNVTINRIV